MAGGISMLETPPWIIALTFAAFIALTIVFEKLVHLLTHFLQKRQAMVKHRLHHPDPEDHGAVHKHEKSKAGEGLLTAVHGMIAEITAVGFVSLLLISFQNDIVGTCGRPEHYAGSRWLDFQDGLPCCLTKTKSVTPCFFAYEGSSQFQRSKSCAANYNGRFSTNYRDSTNGWYKVNATGVISELSDKDRKTNSSAKYLPGYEKKYAFTKCYQKVQVGWDECGNDADLVPVVGLKALHEIHVYIFFIAACQILVTVILICASYLQIALWRYWLANPSSPHIKEETMKAVDAHATELEVFQYDGLSHGERSGSIDEISHAKLTQNLGASETPVISPFDPVNSEQDIELNVRRPRLPDRLEIPRARTWRGRSEHSRSFLKRCIRQLFPLALSKNELEVLEAAFLYTHEIQSSHNFSFLNYLQASIEDDFGQMVGLSPLSWLFLILYILLTTVMGLLLWPIMVLSALVLLGLTIVFINLMWHMTRGGHVHKHSKHRFLFNSPWIYTHFIKFAGFLLAFDFANELFFATQYGPNSCFFRSSVPRFGKLQGSVYFPWWGYLLLNVLLLTILAVVVAPLFSVVVHGGKDFKPDLLAKPLRKQLLQQRNDEKKPVHEAEGVKGTVGNFLKKMKPKTMASSMNTLASVASPPKSTAMGDLPVINEKCSYHRQPDQDHESK